MKNKKRSSYQPQQKSNQFEVEEILDKKISSKGELYLIRWKDYPNPDDYTWEPLNHLTQVKNLIKKFNEKWNKDRVEDRRRQMAEKKQRGSVQSQISVIQISSSSSKRSEKTPKSQQIPKEKKIAKTNVKNQKRYLQRQKQVKQKKRHNSQRITFNKNQPPIHSSPKKPKVREIKPWQEQGLTLGRIHKHFYQEGQLLFIVDLNKDEDLASGSVYLTLGELIQQNEEKVIHYMEKWSRNKLIQQKERHSDFGREFNEYWKQFV